MASTVNARGPEEANTCISMEIMHSERHNTLGSCAMRLFEEYRTNWKLTDMYKLDALDLWQQRTR